MHFTHVTTIALLLTFNNMKKLKRKMQLLYEQSIAIPCQNSPMNEVKRNLQHKIFIRFFLFPLIICLDACQDHLHSRDNVVEMSSVEAYNTTKMKQFDNYHRTRIYYSTLFVQDKIVDFIASLSKDACTITCPKQKMD